MKSTRPDVRMRQQRALELRLAGWSYEAIATELGYRGGKSAACKAVRAALDRQESRSVDELREVEDMPLDALQKRLCAELDALAVGDRPVGVARLCSSLLRVSESRRRLHGLDRAAPRVEVNPGAAEALESLKRRFSELLEAGCGDSPPVTTGV